ncbi:hypothetical protein [Amycolatopsis pithecellobii]|uniref:hypothetical protein n=1 Tax=Amycolatopsis pithecellobii TaxID=664692 RepID=UPI001FEA84FF|nr:hypothetical protein [Amycolatopsis pithecellobii]
MSTTEQLATSTVINMRGHVGATRPDSGAEEGSYNTESLIAFLTELHDDLDRDPVTLIWDGLPPSREKPQRPGSPRNAID